MKLYLLFLSVLLISCGSNSSKAGMKNKEEVKIIDGFTYEADALEDSALFKECHVIPLETNNDSFIRKISRIYKTGDDIFILDASLNKLAVFDNHGNYQYKIESIGNGPREYISLMDFCLDTEKKEILLLCDRPYKSASLLDKVKEDDNPILLFYQF